MKSMYFVVPCDKRMSLSIVLASRQQGALAEVHCRHTARAPPLQCSRQMTASFISPQYLYVPDVVVRSKFISSAIIYPIHFISTGHLHFCYEPQRTPY